MVSEENRHLSLFAAVSLVISSMVGTGVFTSLGYQLVDIQSVFAILMLWLIGMLTTGWFPSTRENFREWVSIINELPDSVWYLVIIVFSASFGTRITKSVLDRKKK